MRYKFLVLSLIITASLLIFIIASLIIFKFKPYNSRTKSVLSSDTVPKRISENQSKQGIHIKRDLNGDGIEEKISVLFKYKNTAELPEGYTIDVTSRNKNTIIRKAVWLNL